jgi:hypothetical protein
MTHHDQPDDRAKEEIHFVLHDWLDFQNTARRVIARRVRARPMPALENAMLKSAFGLLEDGRISIIVKKRDGITTYIAERVL